MFFSADHVLELITQYKYLIIFPIAIVEGPIVTVIAGFLASLGKLNIYVAFAVVALGDLTGDSIFYYIGRTGRTELILKYAKFLGVTKERLKLMDKHFASHTGKILLFGKFSHGVGTPILIASGTAKVKYSKFLFYNIIGTIPKSGFFILIGYFFGSNYKKINGYIDTATIYIFIAIVLLVLAYWVFTKFVKSRL